VDLTRWLLRLGAARPHVLVVPVPGTPGPRLAVEAELARRGWPQAQSPADTDVLVVAGEPGPRLAQIVDALWRQVPSPRALVRAPDAPDAAAGLDGAVAVLADPLRQRAPRRSGDQRADATSGDADGQEPDGDMEMPGGLPMADLGADRDGLTLDRVHVPLGPVLPDWPAGLVVHVTLQGDVVQEAEAAVLDPPRTSAWFWTGAHRAAARELDALGRFLAVAGWDDAADRARRLRDDLLTVGLDAQRGEQVRALVARVRRSWVLRRLVRAIPVDSVDVLTLLERRLSAVEEAVGVAGSPRDGGDGQRRPTGPTVCDMAALARALVGAELAALRLIVAAVDPDTAAAGRTGLASAAVEQAQVRRG